MSPPGKRAHPLDPAQMAAWRSFLRAHDRVMRELDAGLRARHDLSISEYDVLVQLVEAGGHRLRMRDLARATHFSPSGLTRVCERLERLGLVSRERSPADARGTDAVLTADGYAQLRQASAAHLEEVRRRFAAHFGPDELRTLTAWLERIAGEPPLDA